MAATVKPDLRHERTPDSIQAELADLSHQAGRNFVGSIVHTALHAQIDVLLTELEALR